MRRILLACSLLLLTVLHVSAQGMNSIDPEGNIRESSRNKDKEKKEDFPRGMRVWTVDEKFGDISPAVPDTLPEMFMNTIFTTGLRGEFNTTGNVGAARQNRIFTDRSDYDDFIFNEPYGYFITHPGDFHFTNTYSPITNLSFNTCGNRTNGEDHFKALFATNAGKRIGLGMKFDYIYGRGYYSDNSSSLSGFTLWGSYLGDRYQAHLLTTLNHQKQAENGGITNDNYITHPESFNDNYTEAEIPTMLSSNWNRNDNQHIFFTHRYSLGFQRKVPMTEEEIKAKKFAMESAKENAARRAKEKAQKEAEEGGNEFGEEDYERQAALNATVAEESADTTWQKNEYVPVTSFIHTLKFNNYRHIYQAYQTPDSYYAFSYPTIARYGNDSIYDETSHYRLTNTFAVALLEGFNKYAKAGLKAYVTSDLKHFTLPDSLHQSVSYNEHNIHVGGQLVKSEGNTLHYNANAEFCVAGAALGDIEVNGEADLNFRLLKDTVQLAASGFFHLLDPTFYYTHYHSRHFWWDDDEMSKVTHTRIEGRFSLQRTRSNLRVAVDNLTNYAYFATTYDVTADHLRLNNAAMVRQTSDNISILTASLSQQFQLNLLHLDTELTYQKSSHPDIIPLPSLNVYANLYLRFKIAHVLDCDLGADVRYFTHYNAPDFVPGIAQYAVQENKESRVELGGYPIVNAYANFFLKHARFFVMMSHVNHAGKGGDYFLTPHYPLNQRIFRFGVSWNFFN